MTSLDVRNNSAVMKRAEQLKRWEESDTNREPPTPRPEKGRRIKFSSGCVFLAACLSGDKEEVVKLLESGADINTANVDGLTALHQACIDDNLEMVEFLVEHGADINRQDNEGWTPLHATASCGFVSIARYLVEHGADVAAVNSDGDLAVDLAVDIQHMGMIDFMQKMVAEHNIDCEKARQAEEQQMLNDAKRWLRSDASEVDRPHPKTGATALHVAAAKGYTKVLSLLLAGRANVDKQDNDGWTPLHAAAHWSQKEASEMLVDAMADMDVRNYAGQSCIDVAERKMVKFLEELRANNKRMKRRPSSQISSSRISDTIENHIENTAAKLVRVEVRPDPSKDQANASQLVTKRENDSSDVECDDDTVGDGSTCADNVDERDGADCDVDDGGGGGDGSGGGDGGDSSSQNLSKVVESDDTDSDLTDSTESSHSTSISEAEDEKTHQPADSFINQNQQQKKETTSNEEEAPWRRNSSTTRVRIQPETPAKNQVPEKDVKNSTTSNEVSDVILRRTQSFENDEKFYQKYNELRARIKANSCPILPATLTNNNPSVLGTANTTNQNFSVQRSASLKDQRNFRKPATVPTTTGPAVTPTTTTNAVSVAINTTPVRSTQSSNSQVNTAPTTTSPSTNANSNVGNKPSTDAAPKQTTKQSAGNIFKNFFKSFVPPVRDEESETQRKAHAKRVRETRRSTQGVTLDEIKSAEELVKKKNSAMNNNNNNSNNNNNNGSSSETQTTTTTATTTITTSSQEQQVQQVQAPTQTPTATSPTSQLPQISPTPTPTPIIETTTTTTNISATPLAITTACIDTASTATTTTPTSTKTTTEIVTKTAKTALKVEAEYDNGDVDDEDISASFTIVAPMAKQRSSSAETEDDAISASFTLSTRRESRTPTPTSDTESLAEATIVMTPPEITINEAQEEIPTEENDESEVEDADKDEESSESLEEKVESKKTTITATTISHHANATEICKENIPATSSPSSSSSSSPTYSTTNTSPASNSFEEPNIVDEVKNIESEKTVTPPVFSGSHKTDDQKSIAAAISKFETGEVLNATTRITAFAPLPLHQQSHTSTSVGSPSTPTPTLDSPVRLRDKRSLFEIDNANSLTLAEKLRNEANKYSFEDRNTTVVNNDTAAASASDSDRDSVFSNYSRRSLDSSPLHMSNSGGGGSGGSSGVGGTGAERRPSWRLKFDAGSKFKLEEVSSGNTYSPTNSAIIPSAPAVIAAANLSSSVAQRRINSTGNAINSSTQSLNSIGRPVSAPIGGVSSASSANNIAESHINDRNSDSSTSIGSYASRRLNNLTSTFSTPATTTNNSSSTTTASVTMGANVPPSISSLAKSGEDKENDKENDRSSVTTQAVLQRRRKPKRRSTGVVHLDMDDLDPERQDANAESEEKESGSERASRSRLGSTSSSTAAAPATDDNKSRERSENGGNNIDYKALWEALKVENEKLKSQLKKKDDEVVQSRATLEKITNATTKNSLSEIEKRERRAMERKLSEMEEELKQLEVYKTENQRLKEENGALIRVISKLSK